MTLSEILLSAIVAGMVSCVVLATILIILYALNKKKSSNKF